MNGASMDNGGKGKLVFLKTNGFYLFSKCQCFLMQILVFFIRIILIGREEQNNFFAVIVVWLLTSMMKNSRDKWLLSATQTQKNSPLRTVLEFL